MLTKNKKAELDEVILTLGILLAIIIITSWFVLYLNKSSVSSEDIEFNTLLTFASYYKVTAFSVETNITNVDIKSVSNTTLIVNNSQVCLKNKNFVTRCIDIFKDINFKKRFNLKKDNFFTFIKKDNKINITLIN